jgi:hypothetical protein
MKSDKNNFTEIYIPVTLFLIAFIWKFIAIGNRDICLDEPFTIYHAQSDISDIIKLPSKNEPTPPLFMLLLHIWIKLFGISAYSVRVLPILFNALTTVFLYLTGKRFFSFWSGIIASGLFIFSTYHFYFGADTRSYSMLSFATAASLYYLFSVVKTPQKYIYTIALIISNLILVYGHYLGWLVVFMELAVSLFYIKNQPVVRKILIAVLTTAIFYIPMFSILINQFFISKDNTWVTPPPGYEYVHQLQSFINSRKGLRILLYALASGIVTALITKVNKMHLKELIILFFWWFVPYSFMFLISSEIPIFTDRYILFNSVGFYLFIGVSVSFLFQKVRYLVPLLSAGLLFLMFWYMSTDDYAPRKVKAATGYIQKNMNDSSTIIIYAHWADLEFNYYYNPEIFKSTTNYDELLNKNKIYRAWSLTDTEIYLKENNFKRVIFYQNNTALIDPENSIFYYLNNNFYKTDSIEFEGGLTVTIFNTENYSLSK